MGDALDMPTLRRAMQIYADALREHRDELNSLNVYPVPDGDTGTNMLLTQESVVAALDEPADARTPGEVAAAISRASLMGARGNSGVILSQILRGIVEAMPPDGVFDPRQLAGSLQRASDEAYRAVARPAEGTVLSVIRDAATAAGRAAGVEEAGCAEVLGVALEEARSSLARTTEQLPALRRSGVVDAGAKGIVLLLDALLAAVSGGFPSEPVGPIGPVGSMAGERADPPLEFASEVQFLLEAPDEAMPSLRSALGELGDSVVVVGGGGLFNVHVHTNDPDRVVEVGRRAGRPQQVQVTSLQGDVAACLAGQGRAVQVAGQLCALVAVAEGDGMARAFGSLGAVVVTGGPGNDPAVSDLLAAIEAAPADHVLVLPNHPNVLPTAARAVGETTRRAEVVTTASLMAGLAAATAFNPTAPAEDNAAAMKEAVDRMRSGELARAERDAVTPVGPVRPGQWLGVAEGETVIVADTAAEAAVAVAGRLAGRDAELLTLIVGAGIGVDVRPAVEAALRGAFPELMVEVLDGGQPRNPFHIGIE